MFDGFVTARFNGLCLYVYRLDLECPIFQVNRHCKVRRTFNATGS
jgi:hypothetical protein